ncbi:geraniol 8-hydroxylase-like [Mercurialis annua]|uniref:geraniol 8-hydroxylase-like n=1 Tax=Mercurialis annua TaxID=3986 RepID=UPI0021608CCE|nr:geraniol 8-hydroxylase-like [Mercurialis annua]
MEFSTACLMCFFLFLITLLVTGMKPAGSKKLPRGPTPLPIIGNLLHLGDKPHKSLAKLAKIHGPIMSLKLGRITTIVISSETFAKEILQTQDVHLADRAVGDALYACDHYEVSLPFLPVGPLWRKLRKICNSHIFSSQRLDANQNLRSKKIQQLISDVQECCSSGKAMNIGQEAFKTMLNALSSTIFSLDLTDSKTEEVREFKKVVRCIMDEVGKPNLSDYFPLLKMIDPQGVRRRMTIYFGKILGLIDSLMDERLKLRRNEGYIPANDMLDTLLDLNEDDGLDRNCIKHLFLILFIAGTDTTSSTLEWAMTELLRNPITLSKAQAEIEHTIGRGKLLHESQIDHLPYLKAVVKETFRLHPAVPLLLPRKARSDLEIMNGFTIPKDAQTLVNVWAIGRDPNLWEDSESFRPERFLGSDIDIRGRNFELIPFGAGRRICPGLPLAMRSLYLMLGSLINCFDWKLEDGVKPENMDMEDKFGITLEKAEPLRAIPSLRL